MTSTTHQRPITKFRHLFVASIGLILAPLFSCQRSGGRADDKTLLGVYDNQFCIGSKTYIKCYGQPSDKSLVPVSTSSEILYENYSIDDFEVFSRGTCILFDNQSVRCPTYAPLHVSFDADVSSFSVSQTDDFCVQHQSGSKRCIWYDQVKNEYHVDPISVFKNKSRAISVADGVLCSCDGGGSIRCVKAIYNRNEPEPVPIFKTSSSACTDVSQTSQSVCMLSEEGHVACRRFSNLFEPIKDIGPPAALPQLSENKFEQISAGHRHVCAITRKNGLRCWGDIDVNLTNEGQEIFKKVSSGGKSACALLQGGAIKCWGLAKGLPERTKHASD